MGSLGDGDDRNEPIKTNPCVYSPDIETQPFDSQFSPSSLPGEKVEDGEAGELHFDDTVPVEDAYETQVLNFGGETQVLNFGGETQVLDYLDVYDDEGTQLLDLFDKEVDDDCNGETQVFDYLDGYNDEGTQLLDVFDKEVDDNCNGETQVLDYLDGYDDEGTQLLDVFDKEVDDDCKSERSDRTEVLDDVDDIGIDDIARRGNAKSLENEKFQRFSVCEQGDKGLIERPDALSGECCNTGHSGLHVSPATPVGQCIQQTAPGSGPRFTSIRAASLRASGLAASSRALKGIDSDSCSVSTSGLYSDQHTIRDNGRKLKVVEEVDQVLDLGKAIDKEMGLRNENKCKSSSIVRKLFSEDSFSENKEPPYNSNNINGGEELLQLRGRDGELAGLSYIDSQEPGELSQADALNFVEMFIEKNSFAVFDHEVDRGKSTGGKSKLVSTVIGPQSLAKKANDRNTVGETRIFDWDDIRENDGGGEIFCRKKQEFFGQVNHQRSLTEPPKPRKRKLNVYKDNEERVGVHDKIMVQSDSRVTLRDIKKNEKKAPVAEMKIKKSLVSELGEQFNIDSPRRQLEAVVTNNDVPEMLSVGPDTQMAAEAMEALICGEGITNHDVSGPESESNVSLKGSLRGNCKNRVSSNKPSSQKRVCLSVGATTRQSTRMKSTGAELRKDYSVSLVKRSKNIGIECDNDLATSNMKRAKSSAEGHITTRRSKNMDEVPSKIIKQGKAHGARKPKEVNRCLRNAAQSGGHSIKKRNSNEEASSRMRYSVLVNQLRRAELALDENIAASTDVVASELLHAKKKSKVNSSKPTSNQSRELENGKPNKPEELYPKLTCMSSGIDALRYPKRRRSCRNLSGQDNGFDKLDAQSKPDFVQVKTVKHFKRKSVADPSPCAKNAETDGSLDKSPINKYKASDSSYTSPGNCMTPVNAASPVCMGNEYYKQSCKKNLLRSGLLKEISSLSATEPKPISPPKDLRKRKDMAEVRALFSNHLDEDTIKQQKKILARLGASEATSITDATHFITDNFVRTRNMLEAIASGKPVVTPLWLESIGQVKIHMDEEAFVLRDSKKEKEFGFSMPVSLARARKHPLLQGRRVLMTPNTKPGKETIARLVTAVHGQAIERMGRSALKDGKVPDDLLILSCEEDYEICEPFLEKGVAIYSSELLLNGIVTQKLEYERHRLFADHVKQTRSTVWLNKDGRKFHPVTNLK
ncbi:hypothetical protein Ddye_021793 [Dipteronia dyeriana]|uniref:BRCT domain-containing protein n=1 Tax=Dipteronia dyeriana TaxID=168575 RepID=A0AAD9U306_9ROSI|nr:hypothetical protein Ddye_021793 [Dipteronia dyeriana]